MNLGKNSSFALPGLECLHAWQFTQPCKMSRWGWASDLQCCCNDCILKSWSWFNWAWNWTGQLGPYSCHWPAVGLWTIQFISLCQLCVLPLVWIYIVSLCCDLLLPNLLCLAQNGFKLIRFCRCYCDTSEVHIEWLIIAKVQLALLPFRLAVKRTLGLKDLHCK